MAVIDNGTTIGVDPEDWRVRLHLADNATYLYKAEDPGILYPLQESLGIIFPYTPEISVQYNASYQNYDLTHSNYRGYFYTGSQVQNVLVNAVFTANDVKEANYLLATMHFLRSATKMFYGNDMQNGMPPPVVFLTGLGEYQFNNHPCVITAFQYNLPNDVDYIACGVVNTGTAPAKKPLSDNPAEARRTGAGVSQGAETKPRQAESNAVDYNDIAAKVYSKATYVPTKINLTFQLNPIQTRDQVSKEFSLKDYASGKLLKGGFW